METTDRTLPLIGNEKLIQLGAKFDYSTGFLTLPSTSLRFLRAANDLFFLPLEGGSALPPTEQPSAPADDNHNPGPPEQKSNSSLPCDSCPSLVLANGGVTRVKAARRRKRRLRRNRTRDRARSRQHVSENSDREGEGEGHVPSSLSSEGSRSSSSPPSPPPVSQAEEKDNSSPSSGSVSNSAVYDLIRAHHEWLGHPGILATWRSLQQGLSDLLPSGKVSRRAVRRALLPCLRGGTCSQVKCRHAGDGKLGSLEVKKAGEKVCCDLILGLEGGYSLQMQDQYDEWLGTAVVEEKSSKAIWDAFHAWSGTVDGDMYPYVQTDHGPEFEGDFAEELAKRKAKNPHTPVASHHSLGKTERSHREWLAILRGILHRGILHDRGEPPSAWKQYAHLATAKYNRIPRGKTQLSPFERRRGQPPSSPPLEALRDLLRTPTQVSGTDSCFPVGSPVSYHHPDEPRSKLAPVFSHPATVMQRLSEHVFRLRLQKNGRSIIAHRQCIRARDSTESSPVLAPAPAVQPSPHPSNNTLPSKPVPPPSHSEAPSSNSSSGDPDPPSFPRAPRSILDFKEGELIMWQDSTTHRCFLGSVRGVDAEDGGRVEVQAWGGV
uniref:Integrase catalytic domain-containing protein n=1 Tax=Chromera velia CCMP2878 TaxID=1169474 RepID=A0A0G4HVB3_9ALVE|eukprot:Cvel_8827.t1-p1 / transcript=Cvel_8827.t1 / gene=Cvel_8827 / organism=Chromera_velia_CCMP2878 / gene_product=hypothetical protein / transcript_product=hypothetical protein / location=Cvel_scaffold495:10598-12409(+) / protein_length=604 / sequence_SO=supercontig / SO=protein_coding / is_pseudo=false